MKDLRNIKTKNVNAIISSADCGLGFLTSPALRFKLYLGLWAGLKARARAHAGASPLTRERSAECQTRSRATGVRFRFLDEGQHG